VISFLDNMVLKMAHGAELLIAPPAVIYRPDSRELSMLQAVLCRHVARRHRLAAYLKGLAALAGWCISSSARAYRNSSISGSTSIGSAVGSGC